MATLLAHISDLHLDGGERATRRASRVMDYLRGMPRPVDALLVTGDIADHGTESEYEDAVRILTAPFPVLACPGNHDMRAVYRKTLLGQSPGDGPINQVHHVAGIAILMCDSTIPGHDEGRLDAETVAGSKPFSVICRTTSQRCSLSTNLRSCSTTRCPTPAGSNSQNN